VYSVVELSAGDLNVEEGTDSGTCRNRMQVVPVEFDAQTFEITGPPRNTFRDLLICRITTNFVTSYI
jgi:hypothetical protein